MFIGESNSIIRNFETYDFGQCTIELRLIIPDGTDRHSSILPSCFINCLDGINNNFNQRCVNGRRGPDVVNGSFDIDVAHSNAITSAVS